MHSRVVWGTSVVLLALPLIAGAQETSTYTGCLNRRTGSLTQVAIGNLPAGVICPRNTVMIHWNQQGPKGDKGDQGEPGPAPDMSEYYTKTQTDALIAAIPLPLVSINAVPVTIADGEARESARVLIPYGYSEFRLRLARQTPLTPTFWAAGVNVEMTIPW